MVVKKALNMRSARARAKMARSRGLRATVFRVKGDPRPRVSVTRVK